MIQPSLFDAPPKLKKRPADERCQLWLRRQSGIYVEICDEINRLREAGIRPVSIASALEVLADQPDLAVHFTDLMGYDAAFAVPLREALIRFGDFVAEDLAKEGV